MGVRKLIHLLSRVLQTAIGVSVYLLTALPGPAFAEAPADDGTAILAVVGDGPSERYAEHFALVHENLAELAAGDYALDLRMEFRGDFTPQGVRRQLERALADPTIEVVFAAGPIATELSALLPDSARTKPIFGGFPELSDRHGNFVSENGTSALPNFTFAATPRRVGTDFSALRSLTGADTIYAIMDAGSYKFIEDDRRAVEAMEAQVGAKLVLVPTVDSADDAVERLPADAKAVYLTILPRYTDAEGVRLLKALAGRGIFTLALTGPAAVYAGATASLAADLNESIARRSAVTLHQLFLGTSTADVTVYLPSEDRLFINSRVADQIGWSPDYATYLSAEFTGKPIRKEERPLKFETAMDLAASYNSGARAVREGIAQADAELRIARSFLLPRIDFDAQHGISRFENQIASPIHPPAPDEVHAGRYGAELSQILFDDSVWSGFRAQRRLTDAARHDALSAELDARAAGGAAYLAWVRAYRLHEIEEQNLRLSTDNLRLARLRVEIGEAEASEIFRWESQLARSRAIALQQLSRREQRLAEMNQVLGQPPNTRWQPRSIHLRDSDVYFMNSTLAPIVAKSPWPESLRLFFQELAVENSPELASFDESIEAQGIILGQKKRAYYAPSVSVRGGFDHILEGGEDISTQSENEWSAGVALTIPLFESGRRSADIDRQHSLIRQLEARRDSVVESLERDARTAIDQMAGDHANIRLSRRAVEAAEKNYQSAQEKYSQGAATILDLLDAQSGLLLQRLEAVAAVYNYMIGTVSLQRTIAWFEATATDAEREAMHAELKGYMNNAVTRSKYENSD